MGKKKRTNKIAQASLAMRRKNQGSKLTQEMINERIITIGPVSQAGFDRAYHDLTEPGGPLLHNYAGVVEGADGDISTVLVPVSDVEHSGLDGTMFFQQMVDRSLNKK